MAKERDIEEVCIDLMNFTWLTIHNEFHVDNERYYFMTAHIISYMPELDTFCSDNLYHTL